MSILFDFTETIQSKGFRFVFKALKNEIIAKPIYNGIQRLSILVVSTSVYKHIENLDKCTRDFVRLIIDIDPTDKGFII